jgi:ArsR family transcriptional regulator, arsenate/arsenite/antimonite-responsive transcriptional repressor
MPCQSGDQKSADRLRALGHPVRLAIVRRLAEGDCCCCSDFCDCLPLAQSTISQHLKVLKDAGLLRFSRDGVRSSYVLDRDALAAVWSDIEALASMGVVGTRKERAEA